MKRGWFLILALSVGLNAGLLWVHLAGPSRTAAVAGDRSADRRLGPRFHPEGPPGFIRERLGRIGPRLGLDAEQRERMAATLTEMIPRVVEARQEVDAARDRLRRAYAAEKISPDEVRERVRDLGDTEARLDSIVSEAILREAVHLTPEQRAAYLDMMPWGRPHGPGPLHHGRGGGQGGPHRWRKGSRESGSS